jgi:hydrogen peroxide-dependent heme synthase
MAAEPRAEISLRPSAGWHCGHFFYRFDRARLAQFDAAECGEACRQFAAILDPAAPGGPARLQTFLISGHKADFGLLALDPDPLVVGRVHQRLLAGPLGSALVPAWSFVSMTELSEYVPTVEQYGQRLQQSGADAASEEYHAKLAAYQRRWGIMTRQRLHPDLPSWPAICFYPMNKRRAAGENWYLLDFAQRERLMGEHGESGMKFGGKVTQLVTVGLGLDDWEWGVTLWARNPEFLPQIVYRMRFDEASARYGEFGPFYTGYQASAAEILRHCAVEKG